jgi:hypothetical protein
LIGDANFSASVTQRAQMVMDPGTGGAGGMGMNPGTGGMAMDLPSLATIVQQRLYTPGPTEVLRILHALDDRVAELDPRPSEHPCLTSAPTAQTFALPGGQSFTVQLQCLQRFGDGTGWVAFGFGNALPVPPDAGATDGGAGGPPDGGALAADGGGNDFYLVEGQTRGLGGAYHVDRRSGNVEGWVAVADSGQPSDSQVLMHLVSDQAAMTFEMTLGGTGVGFCAAHLKTGRNFLFIDGRPNVPAPPGLATGPTDAWCDSPRTGCFDTSHLDHDLGAGDTGCAGITAATFAIPVSLDAAPDGNVVPAALSTIFNTPPAVPAY